MIIRSRDFLTNEESTLLVADIVIEVKINVVQGFIKGFIYFFSFFSVLRFNIVLEYKIAKWRKPLPLLPLLNLFILGNKNKNTDIQESSAFIISTLFIAQIVVVTCK